MRILEKVKDFILSSKKKNRYVFQTWDIAMNVKQYLLKENMLYSPIRGIYILKKSDVYNSEVVLENKNSIISQLWWVVSGMSWLAYYKGNFDELMSYKIITKSKNFITYIGEWKKIEVVFSASKIPRITKKITINNDVFEIETLLSLVINDFKIIDTDADTKKLLLKTEINSENIEAFIKKWFKISWISKLALFYQSEGFNDKYNIIKRVLERNNKRLDSRWTQGVQKHSEKTRMKKEKIDLNSLL